MVAAYPWNGYAPFDAFPMERKLEFIRHDFAWSLSQFLHGEQGALLVASQLASCAPSFNAKLYAASQTFDEARHVEVFNRYLRTKVGFSYPVTGGLKDLLDKILTDPRWDLKFIGMQNHPRRACAGRIPHGAQRKRRSGAARPALFGDPRRSRDM